MNIAPVCCANSTSFSGIQEVVYLDSGIDHSLKVDYDITHYEYYPFLDESEESIDNVKKSFNYTYHQPHICPRYDLLTSSKIEIKDRLPITQEQYKALKKEKLSDDSILKIFA